MRTCGVCAASKAKYTCPRCNVAYCALPCYRAHSTDCTEKFYRAHVEGETALRRAEDAGATRRDADEMLRRMANFDAQAPRPWEVEEEDGAAAAASPPPSPLPLATQLRDFERAVRAGRLARFVALWTPWWEDASGVAVVPQLQPQPQPLPLPMAAAAPFPATPTPLAQLAGARSPPPSPLLRYSVADVGAAYAFAARTYNGDWSFDVEGAAEVVLDISATLAADARHASGAAVLRSALERLALASAAAAASAAEAEQKVKEEAEKSLVQPAAASDAPLDAHAALVRDALGVLATPAAVQRALRELDELFEAASAARRNRALRAAARKVRFVRSWASESLDDATLAEVRGEIVAEFTAHTARRLEVRNVPTARAAARPLIEELDALDITS